MPVFSLSQTYQWTFFFQFLTNVEEITNVYKSAFFPTITNVYYIYGCRHEEEIEESRKRHEVT